MSRGGGRRSVRSRMMAGVPVLVLMLGLNVASSPALAQGGERFPKEPWGLDSPASRCVVCHSLEEGGPFRSAPNLFGIVGADKARDREWYGYSLALMEKGGTWTEDELDAYLSDARSFAPGTRKSIRIRDDEERAQLIEFLATLTP